MNWQVELRQCSHSVFAYVAVDAFRRLSSEGHPPELVSYLDFLTALSAERGFPPLERFAALLAVSYELGEGSVVQVTLVVAPLIQEIAAAGLWSETYDEVLSRYGLAVDVKAGKGATSVSQCVAMSASQLPASVTYVEPAVKQRAASVVIMCALNEEFDAFSTYFAGTQIRTGVLASRKYRMGAGEHPIVLVSIGEMGNVEAALATRWAIDEWRPGLVILAGIAGGVESSIPDFARGDLVVPPQIVGYELAKISDQGVQRRLRVATVSARALNMAKEIVEEGNWVSSIAVADPERPDATPQVHFGALLSGEKVVASIDVVHELSRLWPGSIGVEMEAVGLAIAAYQSGTAPEVLVAKAACDWADSAKDDLYHPRAAAVSAAFCMVLANAWHQRHAAREMTPVRRVPRTDGLVKNAFSNRLDNIDAKNLANVVNVERRYMKVWETADMAQKVWEWLEDRGRLSDLPDKLVLIGRRDLSLLFYEDDDSILGLFGH